MNVVIMGATSHIAKGLIERFLKCEDVQLRLFTRSPEKVRDFLPAIDANCEKNSTIHQGYGDFESFAHDVIVNCVGVETRNKEGLDYRRYFSVTEEFDNLAIGYLQTRNPDALYVSFSSGAVYGKGFAEPVDEKSVNVLPVNHMALEDSYGIVRLNAEAKHRAHSTLKIADLRVFSYFSRYINLNDGYFITDVLQAVLKRSTLITDEINIVRDYLHPQDLFSMVLKCMQAGKVNQAFDVSSAAPVSKQEILDYFSSAHGLKYERRASRASASATGQKSNYYSRYDAAAKIGYSPQFNSMETIRQEAGCILSGVPESRG